MDLSKNFQALMDSVAAINKLTQVPEKIEAIKPMQEGFARGATADLAGGPVDLINLLLSPLGLGSKEPVGGSKSIRSMLGMPKEEKQGPEAAGAAAGGFVNPANLLAAGMMIGPKAANFSSKLAARMLDMKRNGATPAEAYRNTGSLVAPDGYLRQEITDRFAKLKGDTQGVSAQNNLQWLLDHPDLYANYPELKNMIVKLDPTTRNGSYTGYQGVGRINVGTQGHQGETRSVLLHEIQHAIQDIEGWARGGSPGEDALKPLLAGIQQEAKDHHENVVKPMIAEWGKARRDVAQQSLRDGLSMPDAKARAEEATKHLEDLVKTESNKVYNMQVNPDFEAYMRLQGEAEARNTQTRAGKATHELRDSFPLDTYDRPIDKLIKLFNGDSNSVQGSFLGQEAKTANLDNLAKAKQMHNDGVGEPDILKQTGWFRGIDSQWRYEIPSNKASFKNAPLEGKHKVGDILDFPELFQAYPEIANKKLLIEKEGRGGATNGLGNIELYGTGPKQLLSTLKHELQHVIQDKEGFAPGGSPHDFYDHSAEEAQRLYKTLMGEAEARLVQHRGNMTDAQLASENPMDTLLKMLNREGYKRSDLHE